MRDVVEIGLGKTAQRGYHLDDIAIVPSRRTRDVDDVSTEWKLDAYPFKIPCVAHPSDATMSPQSAVALGRLGGLGVLNAEGLWTRYEDPTKILEELAGLDEEADATKRLQEVYSEPIRPELIAERVRTMREGGITVAVRVSPQHTLALAPVILDAGVDLLVIQGTLVSAEHVSTTDEPLNLKEFIADLDLPVIVGGCTDYKTALHLMRTGAAGVIVGIGADAVMLGEPLSLAEGAPAGGAWWHSAASHPSLPRGGFCIAGEPDGTLEELLYGPADRPDGQLNLFGGLKRAMAKCGYHDVKEFQKVSLVLDR